MDFVVIDVETANADLSSICQVGIASFMDGALQDSWVSLVDPEDEFDFINTSIHGIDEKRVRGAPSWARVLPIVESRLANNIVVSHTAFDRVALSRACERGHLSACEHTWLDSARVVRRAWPAFCRSGYGLSNMAENFGIQYRAHDALGDAQCAGELLLRAIAETGLDTSAVRSSNAICWRIEEQMHKDWTCLRQRRLLLCPKRSGSPSFVYRISIMRNLQDSTA